MLFADGALALILLGLWLFCIFDVITTDSSLCRNLPKGAWVIIVLILPEVGSILWLVAGHTWQAAGRPGGLPYKGNTGHAAGYRLSSRPSSGFDGAGYGSSPARASNPDDDEAFLRRLKERADSQRRAAPLPPEDPDKA